MGQGRVVLAAGTFAQTSQAAAYSGLAVLAPTLRDRYDLSLSQVGVMLGIANVGSMMTLLAWGLAADRIGERATATIGLSGAAGGLALAAYAPSFVVLVATLAVAGALGASVNTATGRAVTSWFHRQERGFALGIRQTAVPIGGFLAALALPPIADHSGSRAALLALAALSAVAAGVAAGWLVEGPVLSEVDDEADVLRRPLRDRRIWRLSTGSALLVLTQVAATGFLVLFLEARGYSNGEAGAVLAVVNVLAVAGRLVAGRLSDRGAQRVAPIVRIALATAAALMLVSLAAHERSWMLIVPLVVAGSLSMCWNGLAVTATVELAGTRRSGAALGLQQTLLGVAIVVAPLVFAPLVAATSWRIGFAFAAAVPVVAASVLHSLGR